MRNSLWCVVLLGCGGSTTTTVPTPTAPVAQPVAQRDPAAEARRQFENPGGMWMPMQMPQHASTFKQLGVAMSAESLADPTSAPLAAVVSLGGCTASFVSPDGLIVTNHHCVQGALVFNSTKDKNLVEDGFLAKTRADELPAGPAQRVMVVQSYKDITHEIRDGLEQIADPVARKEESEKRHKAQIAACEKDRPWLRCSVSSFFRGGMYQLIEMLEIRDVRLVYVPKRAVGNYGGEVDNWEWPRHTGDWSFYRAYVGKDGKPAEPSPENVPFKPPHWLKVSTQRLVPGDFVMVAGYPGSTSRLDTAAEVHHDVDWQLPYEIAHLQQTYDVATAHLGDENKATAIKATNQKQLAQNYLEKYQGELAGLSSGTLLAQKDQMDKVVHEWAAQPGREEYKAGIAKMESIFEDEFRTARVDYDRGAAFRGSKLLAAAVSFTRWAEERPKPDADRKPGYQDRDVAHALAGQKQFARTFDRTLDHDNFKATLVHALQLPEPERPWLATLLDAKKGQKIDEALIEKTIDRWYRTTKLEDETIRIALLEKGTLKELAASKDPFVRAAHRIWATVKAQEKKEDARAGELLLVSHYYPEAMKAALGGALSPDANHTLRVTYGTVRSLRAGSKQPADWPFTTATQILAKNTGKEPFDAPETELAAIKAKRFGTYGDPAVGGDLPVDFLSDLDITNGNSGSPTLNDKGELVGLAFDGNKEGISSDVVFNPKTTRTIHVDTRYMIWMMDAVDGADHLVKEMGLPPQL